VTELFDLIEIDPARTVSFLCGPEVMMRYAIARMRDMGLSEDRIFLSTERNMKCAVAFCGHCQFGPTFVCREGPVYRYDRIQEWFEKREI